MKFKLWGDSFAINEPRINDDALQKWAKTFTDRAQSYQFISWFLLVVTVLIIGIGISVFIRGDPGDEIFAESEVDLHDKINAVQRKIDDLNAKTAQAEDSLTKTIRAEVLTGILARAKSGVLDFRSMPESRLVESTLGVLKACNEILRVVGTQATEERLRILVSDVQPGDTNIFPAAAVNQVRDAAASSSVNLTELGKELDTLIKELDSLRLKKPPADQKTFAEADLAGIRQILEMLQQVPKLDTLHASATARTAAARAAMQVIGEDSVERLTEMQKLTKEKESLQRDLTKVREQREKILFMSWVPGLTLRVGTVILLLFLTQVLLSTYRYGAGLSAFYLARSDAILLLQGHPDNPRRYAPEQLQQLTEILTPSRYQIDAVKDPTDQLTDLAKTWIARK